MSKIVCDHCALEYPDEMMIKEDIDGNVHHFCCKGCQGVFYILKAEGLDSFYKKTGDVKLTPPKEYHDDISRFDLESFSKKYIKKEDGRNSVSLILEGIHCAACVWLNERVLGELDGIIEASINFTTHKAKITWDDEKIQLSKIIATIRSIGYNAYPYDPRNAEERVNRQRREYISRMVVAIFATMNIMWLSLSRYVGLFQGMDDDVKELIYLAEFFLATPVLFYSGFIYYRGAYFGIKNRIVNMDMLVATGASAAYLYSIYAAFILKREPYFDSVAMIVTFVLIGKFLEVRSKKSAVDAIDMMISSVPQEVIVVDNEGKTQKSIEEVNAADIIEVRAGDKIVFDSVVFDGEASIDMSPITGESIPISVAKGDRILSGGINLDGRMLLKVEKDYRSSTLFSIISLIEDAITKKPKIEQLANRISEYFSVVILSISVLSFIGWYFAYAHSFESSLLIAISVVIIACPCALALATPIATLIGIGAALKRGVLFKAARHIETLAKADVLLLDKTGTITKGRPEVFNAKFLKEGVKEKIYALAESSGHPVAKGVAEYLKKEGDAPALFGLENVKSVPARGIKADFGREKLIGGSVQFLKESGIECDISSHGLLFAVAIDGELAAYFELDDPLKEGAKEAISAIKKMGIEIMMLTGDHKESCERVAKEAGLESFRYGMLPSDKAEVVERLHQENRIVVMAGDGINDAIALSKSDIAIAMHGGADVAIEVSDVVVLNDSLKSVNDALMLGRRTYFFIKQNMAISLAYNMVTVPLAVTGLIVPLFAAIAMSLSSLMVVGNSLRIRNIKESKHD